MLTLQSLLGIRHLQLSSYSQNLLECVQGRPARSLQINTGKSKADSICFIHPSSPEAYPPIKSRVGLRPLPAQDPSWARSLYILEISNCDQAFCLSMETVLILIKSDAMQSCDSRHEHKQIYIHATAETHWYGLGCNMAANICCAQVKYLIDRWWLSSPRTVTEQSNTCIPAAPKCSK